MELRLRLMQREISQLDIYHQFLIEVCKQSEEFSSPEAIKQRYENLNTTKK